MQIKACYNKKDINDYQSWLPGVVHYSKMNEEGKFVKTDLSKHAEQSFKGLGREFKKMSAEEKKKYLDNLKAKEEMRKIKEKLNLTDDGQAKVEELKRQIH